MIIEKVIILNQLGLHARAAARLVHLASRYASDITLIKQERRGDAKSIMDMMTLAASQGTELELRVNGEDELEAIEALKRIIADRFGEKE